MTNFTANATLGGSGTNEPFITGTRTWAGGQTTYASAYNNQPFEANTGVTITARDCNLQANQIKARGAPGSTATPTPSGSFQLAGAHNDTRSPTYTFDNVIMDMNEANQGWTRANLNWTNVTWYNSSTRTDTVGLGNWGASTGTGAINFNTVNLWGDVVSNNTNKATSFWFLTPAPSSTFLANNVSFWNGQFAVSTTDAGNLRSSSAQFGNGTVWNQPTFGPVGQDGGGFGFGGTASLARRIPLRFSAPSTTGNIQTIVGSPDCRAWHNLPDPAGLNANAAGWALAVDGAAQAWWINPLEGIPTNGLSLTNVTILNASAAQVFTSLVGTRLETLASDYILVNNSGVPWYSFPDTIATTNAASVATTLTGNIQAVDQTANSDISDNGFAFQTQTTSRTFSGNTNATTFGNGSRDLDYTVAPARTFRLYKWSRTDWGTEYTVTPPASGASDADVATARTNGYLIHNGASFEGRLNVDSADVFDEVFSDPTSDFSTPAETRTNTAGGAYSGSAVWAMTKLEAWDEVSGGTATGLVPIMGRRNGTAFELGDTTAGTFAANYDLTLIATAVNPIVSNADRDTLILETDRYDVTDFITTIEAGNITVSGDVNQAKDATGSINPCQLRTPAGGVVTFTGLDNAKELFDERIVAPTLTLPSAFTNGVRNLQFTPGGLSGNMTINNWNTALTVSGLVASSQAGLIVNLVGTTTGNHSLNTLFGANRDFSGVTTNVTINSATAINISLPGGITPAATVVVNGITYVQGTNVTFVSPATHPVQVDIQGIPSGVNWCLYVENESFPRFTSFTLTNANGPDTTAEAILQSDFPNTDFGVTNLTFSSAAGDGTRQQIANLGGTVNDLYLMVGNKTNAIRTSKFVINDPMVSTEDAIPTPQVITATVFPQSIDPSITHNGDLHSVSVHSSGTIGDGTVQPAVGDVVIELSNLAADRVANELQTESVWSDARNSFGWFNGVRSQRGTVQVNAAAGFVDNYDLFEPNGAGGVVKRVFLTDIATTNSRAGVHLLTGTEYSTDTDTTFSLDQLRSPIRRRLDVPVLVASGSRQFIFQQPANLPASTIQDSLGTELNTRGVTRGNLTNVGLNVPIVNEAGDAFETTPTLPTTGG